MAQVFASLFVAAISGLAFLAYRLPTVYCSISKLLWALLVVGFSTTMAWDFGLARAQVVADATMSAARVSQSAVAGMDKAIGSQQIPILWVLGAFAFCAVYLLFLDWLSGSVQDLRSTS